MYMLSLLTAVYPVLVPNVTIVALAAPCFIYDTVDYQPSVPTVRVAVIGTIAFIMFIVRITCLFLFARHRIGLRGHRAQSTIRTQNSIRLTVPRTAEPAVVRSFALGTFMGRDNQLALIAPTPTVLTPSHARVYEVSSASAPWAPLRSSLKLEATNVTGCSFDSARTSMTLIKCV
ncbi:hypothetical protein EWM64_g875 [Hericium alpestre]|uniref:Uncharacterized protein n=1 Tax=Hericium alpestre TaxID=135208 RepID=A0A4Z0A8R9_9AGAM|nr:hypothetical protein EWM64_g875 [Hericium alpestre]